jgi:hypothetical protein
MASEADILRAASFLIKHFGRYAGVAAAERADQALDRNDPAEESLWLRVMRAISQMQLAQPKDDKTLH